jgi:hypothetical protein
VHPRSKVSKCFECDESLWYRLKHKEQSFANALLAAGFREAGGGEDVLSFRRELAVSFTGCNLGVDRTACDQDTSKRARIDFVFEGQHGVVLVELDEDQHKDRCLNSEIARANAIVSSLWIGGNNRHVLVVRFNPDAYRVDGKIRRVPLATRYNRVIGVIHEALAQTDLPGDTWSIQHMFYDVRAGRECIMDDIDPAIAVLCRPPIM